MFHPVLTLPSLTRCSMLLNVMPFEIHNIFMDILAPNYLSRIRSDLLLTSLVAQTVKHLLTMQETRVQSLAPEDLLEKEMATPSSILAWKIPWEELGRLQSLGSQRVRDD